MKNYRKVTKVRDSIQKKKRLKINIMLEYKNIINLWDWRELSKFQEGSEE